MPNLAIAGLASGFDWQSLVEQLTEIERAPQRNLRTEQTAIQERNNAYGSIATQLGVLNNSVTTLKQASLFDGRTAQVSDSALATASASSGAALGSYSFAVSQMATAATRQGTSNAGAPLSATDDVSGLALSSAGFATAVSAGTFTVNGKIITLTGTESLRGVFDKISAATSGAVTATYNAASDKITLAGTGEVVLGSANDTSNFLDVAKLSNNGSDTVLSSASLGAIRTSSALSSANLATAITDGGSGAGKFKINGVEISFDTSRDSVANVLKRINDSTAGVTASYDAANDRFQLVNKATGDVGMALEDITGNFLAATGLTDGTLQRGKNLLYTVNGGGPLSSHSNTISESTSGITGLSLTMLKEGTVTVTVASDTSKIKAAINGFITEFNHAQSMIDSQTASTTDAKGKVTAGPLSGESDADQISSRLRSLANGQLSGLSGTLKQLAALGINSNGDDDTLALTDSAALDDALSNSLTAVKDLFTNETSGLAVGLSAYLNAVVGDDGSLVVKQTHLTKLSADIDTQITDQERLVKARHDEMTASFVSMEQARQNLNQQLAYLTRQFGGSSSS